MQKYKVYFEDRVITLSPEPDRVQKYTLYHKYSQPAGLFSQISQFAANDEIASLNIYTSNINSLWNLFRSWFREVDAAGGLVWHPSGRYLFIMRYGRWDLPKGHVDEGETPEQCALREVSEECSIEGHTILEALQPTYHSYLFEETHILKKTWWYRMNYNGPMITQPQGSEGITHAEWLTPDEIARIRGNAYQSLLDLLYYTLRVK